MLLIAKAVLAALVLVLAQNVDGEFLFGTFPDNFQWGVSSVDVYIENGKYKIKLCEKNALIEGTVNGMVTEIKMPKRVCVITEL